MTKREYDCHIAWPMIDQVTELQRITAFSQKNICLHIFIITTWHLNPWIFNITGSWNAFVTLKSRYTIYTLPENIRYRSLWRQFRQTPSHWVYKLAGPHPLAQIQSHFNPIYINFLGIMYGLLFMNFSEYIIKVSFWQLSLLIKSVHMSWMSFCLSFGRPRLLTRWWA